MNKYMYLCLEELFFIGITKFNMMNFKSFLNKNASDKNKRGNLHQRLPSSTTATTIKVLQCVIIQPKDFLPFIKDFLPLMNAKKFQLEKQTFGAQGLCWLGCRWKKRATLSIDIIIYTGTAYRC